MAKKKTASRAPKKTAKTKKAPTRRVSTASKVKRAAGARTTTKSTAKPAPKKKSTAKKTTAKKPAAKKTTAKKSTAKKSTAKKTAKKSTAKKTTAKKSTAKKTTAKKPTAKKTTAKKSTAKKAAAAAASGKKKTSSKAAAKTTKKRRRPLGSQSVAEAASAAEADAQGYVFINGRRVRMISTGGKGAAPKPRPKKTEVEVLEAQAPKKDIKTHLTAKELRSYREILMSKRSELLGDLDALEKATMESGGASHLSNHMADVGSDTYDQDFMLGMAETERAQLREIHEALERIAKKTYGVCALTGKPIPKTRLNAKPWARYTIEAARLMEGRMGG